MANNSASKLSEESPSVQIHLSLLQKVIERMASNSSSSKAWCITLVSAILVVVAKNNQPDSVLIALIPMFLFFVLDAYYLAMEKGFRNSYNTFIIKLHSKTLVPKDLYWVKTSGGVFKLQVEAMKSFSIWGFYSTIAVLIYLFHLRLS